MKRAIALFGSAFGLGVASEFRIDGLRPLDPSAPRVEIGLDSGEPPWASRDVVVRQVSPDGDLLSLIAGDEATGFRLFAAGDGWLEIAADGSSIVCRPSPGARDWRWQRMLLGQGVPFAAVLSGLEPFHASAVVIQDRVVALAGGPGAGKSTLGLELTARGAEFFTDDVLALRGDGDGVLCEPGPALANVRHARLLEHAETGVYPFDAVIGRELGSVRVLVNSNEAAPSPLGIVYFVERSGAVDTVEFSVSDDPYRLLGHTFNALVDTPERLGRQLDVCARMAASAPQFRVEAPLGIDSRELAAAVEAHAGEKLGA